MRLHFVALPQHSAPGFAEPTINLIAVFCPECFDKTTCSLLSDAAVDKNCELIAKAE